MASLYWFTHDLRMLDNKVLSQFISNNDACYACYFINPQWLTQTKAKIGRARWQFLQQSLIQLKGALSCYNVPFFISIGEPEKDLPALVKRLKVNQLGFANAVSFNECKQISAIKRALPTLLFQSQWLHTLFDQALIDSLHCMDGSFSKFRKKVEKIAVLMPETQDQIKNVQSVINDDEAATDVTLSYIDEHFRMDCNNALRINGQNIKGGYLAGQLHVKNYLASGAASHYKHTRNDLHGLRRTSLFSPWLANGSLSPRFIWHEISKYEQEHEKNDSTNWLKIELLWREFFQWNALAQGVKLFTFQGQAKDSPKTSFYPERFAKWCAGNTPFPMVNAFINELNTTGYMSNRGRQIVASCFVNELQLDWRHGAQYFENHLIDYDAASNWGNWQYIAGVGKDPRGGRKFNLLKQSEFYDKDGEFTYHWGGNKTPYPLDSNDIADWPISSV